MVRVLLPEGAWAEVSAGAGAFPACSRSAGGLPFFPLSAGFFCPPLPEPKSVSKRAFLSRRGKTAVISSKLFPANSRLHCNRSRR